MTGGLLRAGMALAFIYVAAAVATRLVVSPARPLFDGFAPPVPYNWAKPPPEFAAGNFPARAAEQSVLVGEGGSEPANASTGDAQVIVTLPAGALAAHPPDSAVGLRLSPLDAATLGRVPAGLRVVSNAYQLTLAYEPSQAPVTAVGASATIALTAASHGDTLLYSPDGQQWQKIPARPFGDTGGVTGLLGGAGYYAVATSQPATTTTVAGQAGSGSGAAALGAGLAAIVVMAVGAVDLRKRQTRRRARSRQQRRRDARRRGSRR